jgi:hypothetical protein
VADVQRLRLWQSTSSAIIREVMELFRQRKQMSRFIDVVEANPALIDGRNRFPFDVNEWFRVYAAMAIRRLADDSKGDVGEHNSLYKLLLDMRANADDFHRSDMHDMFERQYRAGTDPTLIDYRTDDLWHEMSTDGIRLSRPRIQEDIKSLVNVSKRVRQFVSLRLAHASTEEIPPHSLPKHDDIDDCIDEIARIATHYHNLLHASAMSPDDLYDIDQFDWHEIWRFPWLTGA